MGFTLYDALQETSRLYYLKVLAGKKILKDTSISWVHLVEDTNIINRFWGSELAVTTGIGCDTAAELKKVIEMLIEHKGAGLIINVGKYIETVPEDVIAYCEKNKFPLLTVPWKVHTADLIKDYCFRIFQVQQEEKEMSTAFMELMKSPEMKEKYIAILKNTYDVAGTFQIACIYIENREHVDFIQAKQADYHLHAIFDDLTYTFSFFKQEEYYILIINNITDVLMREVCSFLADSYNKSSKGLPIRIGIGTNQTGVIHVVDSFKRAKAAMRMAIYQEKEQVRFEEMGIYQILFTQEDSSIMTQFSQDTLRILTDYDTAHQSNYEETLYYYLKYDGSIQSIAKEMYTHRNTVSYRLNKIKELLGNPLDTADLRFPYQLAFYIKEISQQRL